MKTKNCLDNFAIYGFIFFFIFLSQHKNLNKFSFLVFILVIFFIKKLLLFLLFVVEVLIFLG